MLGFEIWDVVKVPFPYTNRSIRQHRPAVVVAIHGAMGQPHLLWVLMITSATNRSWLSDVDISDRLVAGLPVSSVVRTAKIATIDATGAERIGCLPFSDRHCVAKELKERLRLWD